jgi:hypothetical protein
MTHPLAGCFKRIERADAHLQTLKGLIGTSELQTDPPGAKIIEPQIDVERNVLQFVATLDLEVPIEFGIVFGDAIHNLHAALDNLAFELASLHGKKPDPKSAFPIWNAANEWFDERTFPMLRTIGPEDRARIESHQPFMRRNGVEPKDQVLARLKRYSNQSKHRVITPLATVSAGFIVSHIEAHGLRIIGARPDLQKPFRKDAVVAIFDVEITDLTDNHVTMEAQIPFFPAVDGEHAQGFLTGAIAYVHDLLVEFADASFGGVPTAGVIRSDPRTR